MYDSKHVYWDQKKMLDEKNDSGLTAHTVMSAADMLEHRMAGTPRGPLANSCLWICIPTWAYQPRAQAKILQQLNPRETGGCGENLQCWTKTWKYQKNLGVQPDSVLCTVPLYVISHKNKHQQNTGSGTGDGSIYIPTGRQTYRAIKVKLLLLLTND